DELGTTPAQVALAWVRHQGDDLIPILGARTPAQLEDNLASLQVALDAEHLARLDELTRVDLGFPMDFVEEEMIQQLMYGGTREAIETTRGFTHP
ncbi:MAG: aldo/keto reductase, partial [Candidatus Thermoplasmatota archaeon]|nr:aldo/keto reductase [Candidatus Thermoplasmatota archaeon]